MQTCSLCAEEHLHLSYQGQIFTNRNVTGKLLLVLYPKRHKCFKMISIPNNFWRNIYCHYENSNQDAKLSKDNFGNFVFLSFPGLWVIGLEQWTKIKHEESPSPSSDQTNSLITNGLHHPLHLWSYFPKKVIPFGIFLIVCLKW